ncbi:MAG: hypothetical protein AAF191_19570, partial [Verrucomicrobiota bacterium]
KAEASALRQDLVQRLKQSKKIAVLTPVTGSGVPRPYDLSVQITSNDTDSWTDEECHTYEETIYDRDGNSVGCITRHRYETSSHCRRVIHAEFELVDPLSGKVNWAWSGSHGETNTRSRESEIGYPLPPPHPSAPSTQSVANNLMKAATRKMSKIPKS